MSVISIPQEPIDMKDVGFLPKLDEDQFRPRKKLESLIVVHEDGSPLKELMIQVPGKSLVELQKEIDAAQKQGLEESSRDAFRIKMQEKRGKPQAFITKVKGDKEIEELLLYINGKQVDTGQGIKTIAPSHPRTWTVGNCNPLTGVEVETDFNVILKNFQESDKFSKITECSWAEMKTMR